MPVDMKIWNAEKEKAWRQLSEDLEIGYLDEDIRPVLLEFFRRPCSFTKSSCSGRIVIVDANMPWERQKATILFKKHSPITVEEIAPFYNQRVLYNLWIIASGPIIHAITCNLKEALTILKIARNAGFKHSGILSIRKSGIVIELVTGVRAEILLKRGNKVIVKLDELPEVVEILNRVLLMGKERLEKLYRVLKQYNEEICC
ncbi:MAG: hypothetical protein DRO15_04085 [Thermoprotei archaeon]|nr:MAG: hypothetical protein DRO15_04085 [Thermoprotei archaeon]